ncbi:nicotinate phosphoribosyltransferase [Sulfuracidifex metallicus]|uniref:nicotinate phosphoribosyltransferase n=1 Tax=Sulfuracidifex metallicus DSM 6482 = JCM 9184 TaxID=523847 RepID=A0A6A9QQF8_SULME|nr:nicotinate phosphoribosyltransferase [Sulfuracidifex metallicus]MUN28043.1 nicotinate phosphoribosyltransferase [Sulfuracidifex metallicus DSM 6482 = JCM 9184]WOE51410.1 nicotinate phosphoribosyltransferase [Sulfuracidifex metallicus DSM 6482 = JCM 9184]
MRLYTVGEEEIRSGNVTDVYFKRTADTLFHLGIKNLKVRMEFHCYGLPKGYSWGVFAGLEEALRLLEGRNVTVYAMDEGTIFREIEPVMIIEGDYLEFGELETALLGVLRHESSIATKAARIKMLALNKQMIFFGLRALHPAISPMVDRAAYIGGMDGVSGTMSEKFLGVKPSGTMPHALMLAVGDNVKAWQAFDEAVEKDVPRIVLVDTFDDERNEALKAASLLKDRLYGIRLDTPSSRRGNFKKIVKEIRWTLDINGFSNVRIIVSGGLDEKDVIELRDVVDSFGIGTSVAFPPSVDFSADIVEKFDGKWIPFTKRGKWPGAKQVYRCSINDDKITLFDQRSELKCEPLLKEYMKDGKLVRELPSPSQIRDRVISQLKDISKIEQDSENN